MLAKGPDAFRTISEVADDLDVPQHVLRFWETRFAPIKPLKRGGGRRYYRPDDVDLLKGIRQLLYGQGYTIRGVQRILKEDGPRFVQAVGRGEQGAPRPSDRPEAEHSDDASSLAAAPDDESPVETSEAAPHLYDTVIIGRGGLSEADAVRLRGALDELLECERILGALRSE